MRPEDPPQPPQAPELESLLAWMDAHLWEPLGWPELMRQSGLSHPALMQLFQKHLGTTPMTWIRTRRAGLPHGNTHEPGAGGT